MKNRQTNRQIETDRDRQIYRGLPDTAFTCLYDYFSERKENCCCAGESVRERKR